MNPSLEPAGYRLKRLAIIILSSLQIVGCIVIAACSKWLADAYVDQMISKGTVDEKDKQMYHTVFLVSIILTALLGIGMQLFGLLGAHRHSLCLSTTYLVFQILGALYSLINAFFSAIYWGSTAWSIAVTTMSLLLVLDMRTKRDNERLRATMHVPPYTNYYA